MAWKDVPLEEAVQYKFYGIRGWLITFYILAALGLLSAISGLIEPDPEAIQLFFNSTGIFLAFSVITLALQLPFLILVPMKYPLMPNIEIACTWVRTTIILPFVMSLDVTMGVPSGFGTGISIFAMVIAALWTWYLLESKRVNLTFRGRVQALELPQ